MNQTLATSPATSGAPRPSAPRVAIIASGGRRDIVASGTMAIRAEFERSHWSPEQIDLCEVSGAFEIPLHAMRLARSGRYIVIIAFSLVVNGGIYRHEFVTAAVIDGLIRWLV